MRSLSLVVAAVVSAALLAPAEAPVPAASPSPSPAAAPPPAPAVGCEPCPMDPPSLPAPAAADDPTLPPLPAQSPRNANYTIDARLDPERHTMDGSLVLEWRNTTGQPQSALPFHLYWNAFRNTLSTSARGEGRRAARLARRGDTTRGFGYIDVRSVHQTGEGGETDLTPGLRYIHPDDANADDRTVAEIATAGPVAPGATTR